MFRKPKEEFCLDKNPTFKDWKRRMSEVTRMKFGLSTEIRDDVAENIDGHINKFNTTVGRFNDLRAEASQFSAAIVSLLSTYKDMTFLTEKTETNEVYECMRQSPYINAVTHALSVNIDIPMVAMENKRSEIEHLIGCRPDLLLDYQHHKRKGEVIAEKLAGATGSKRDALLEEQKQRQVKINTSSSKLRETTDFIVASISAFEYTYPRLRKHVCAAFVAMSTSVQHCHFVSSDPSVAAMCKELVEYARQVQVASLAVHRSPTTAAMTAALNRVSPVPDEQPLPTADMAAAAGIAYGVTLPNAQAPDPLPDFTYFLQLSLGLLGLVFGRPIADMTEVPFIVTCCLSYLKEHAMNTVGLFRVSGDDDSIADLRRVFDDPDETNATREAALRATSSVHNVSCLLKLYLRLLPDPLIPRPCYFALVESADHPSAFPAKAHDVLLQHCKTVNYEVLKMIFKFFHELTENGTANKMNADNLAIVFAPTLMRRPGFDELGINELPGAIKVVRALIVHAATIFSVAPSPPPPLPHRPSIGARASNPGDMLADLVRPTKGDSIDAMDALDLVPCSSEDYGIKLRDLDVSSEWKIVEMEGHNGMPLVSLRHRRLRHSADIYFHGATVTSWVHNGNERLFVSNSCVWNGVKAIRGGVPLVFPQFGRPLDSMPQHGVVRDKPWSLKHVRLDNQSVSAVFSIASTEETLSKWPHEFALEYTVTLSLICLECSLVAINTGKTDFEAHALLHTYIRVPQVEDLCVSGFNHLSYADKTRGGGVFTEEHALATIAGEVDRVYFAPPDGIPDVHLHVNQLPFLSVSKSSSVHTQSGEVLVPTDVVFWNPWIEKAKGLADLDDDAYLYFVCVEPGAVAKWVTVPPQGSMKLSQRLVPLNV